MNRKAKGSRNERRSRDLLKAQGFEVLKAGGSLGVFDLVGISAQEILLVQVKSNAWPPGREIEAIKAFGCPSNCRKVVHRWNDRQGAPVIREVGHD